MPVWTSMSPAELPVHSVLGMLLHWPVPAGQEQGRGSVGGSGLLRPAAPGGAAGPCRRAMVAVCRHWGAICC